MIPHEPPLLRSCRSNATRGRRREKATRFNMGIVMWLRVQTKTRGTCNPSVEGGREKELPSPLMFEHIWMYA